MTAEAARRFPAALTIATAVALAVLLSLGTWQLQRLRWKQDLVARVERSRTAPPVAWSDRPREDPAWTRVRLDCRTFRDGRALYGLADGQIVWRLLALCDSPGGTVIVDRGIVAGSEGRIAPPEPPVLVAPAEIVGVVRPARGPVAEAAREAGWSAPAWYVAAETETPRAASVRPAPLPTSFSNNHLGYAITWYGLAAALAGVYVALLRKRLKP